MCVSFVDIVFCALHFEIGHGCTFLTLAPRFGVEFYQALRKRNYILIFVPTHNNDLPTCFVESYFGRTVLSFYLVTKDGQRLHLSLCGFWFRKIKELFFFF